MSGVKEIAHRRQRRRDQERIRRRIALGMFVGVDDDGPSEQRRPEPYSLGDPEPLRCSLGELVGAR